MELRKLLSRTAKIDTFPQESRKCTVSDQKVPGRATARKGKTETVSVQKHGTCSDENRRKTGVLKKIRFRKGVKTMPRTIRETHLWFRQGDDRIEVESYDKKLTAMIRKLLTDEPDAVCVYSDEDGCLRCSVLRSRLTFRTIRVRSVKCRQAQSENGKRHTENLKHQKREE